jgi:hypothetical protein
MLTRIATAADIDGILALQQANLYTLLPEADRQQHGFVTTPFTVAQIQTLLAEDGAFVAEHEGAIVGYAFAASWDYFSQWPIFPFMVTRFSGMTFAGTTLSATNCFQYGPVCVARSLRGTDTFPQLFATMRRGMAMRYPVGVTFINQQNPRSQAAHQKLSLQVIDEFEFQGRSYWMLAFPTQD